MLINNITEPDNNIEILEAKMNEFENWKIKKFLRKLKMKGKESHQLGG